MADSRPEGRLSAFTFGIADEEKRQEAYRLRHRAYVAIGYFKEGERNGVVIDEYDPHSTIFVARHKGSVVGTIRVTPDLEGLVWQSEKEFPAEMGRLKKENTNMGRKMWEISRVMVDPEFQMHPKLFFELLASAYRFAVNSGVTDFVHMCTPKDSAMYTKMGAVCMAGPIVHPELSQSGVVVQGVLVRTRFSDLKEPYKSILEK